MTFTDRTLTCVQCGQDFTFSADDQRYHAERGFQDPKRCPTCRAERRATQGGSGGSFGGGSSSYGGNGGGSSSYGSREPRQMYSATCASCGREAQVPFQPRGDKPVYCSDCFQPRRTNNSGW
jgi:CxxC-x17-CxxC domain-containing protein